MRVTMLWHGGINYAVPQIEDAEEFRTLGDALNEFMNRLNNSFYPCVERPLAQLFVGGRDECSFDYPDYIIHMDNRDEDALVTPTYYMDDSEVNVLISPA